MGRNVCDSCWDYYRLYPVIVRRAWWNPVGWILGRDRLVDYCADCARDCGSKPTSEGGRDE